MFKYESVRHILNVIKRSAAKGDEEAAKADLETLIPAIQKLKKDIDAQAGTEKEINDDMADVKDFSAVYIDALKSYRQELGEEFEGLMKAHGEDLFNALSKLRDAGGPARVNVDELTAYLTNVKETTHKGIASPGIGQIIRRAKKFPEMLEALKKLYEPWKKSVQSASAAINKANEYLVLSAVKRSKEADKASKDADKKAKRMKSQKQLDEQSQAMLKQLQDDAKRLKDAAKKMKGAGEQLKKRKKSKKAALFTVADLYKEEDYAADLLSTGTKDLIEQSNAIAESYMNLASEASDIVASAPAPEEAVAPSEEAPAEEAPAAVEPETEPETEQEAPALEPAMVGASAWITLTAGKKELSDAAKKLKTDAEKLADNFKSNRSKYAVVSKTLSAANKDLLSELEAPRASKAMSREKKSGLKEKLGAAKDEAIEKLKMLADKSFETSKGIKVSVRSIAAAAAGSMSKEEEEAAAEDLKTRQQDLEQFRGEVIGPILAAGGKGWSEEFNSQLEDIVRLLQAKKTKVTEVLRQSVKIKDIPPEVGKEVTKEVKKLMKGSTNAWLEVLAEDEPVEIPGLDEAMSDYMSSMSSVGVLAEAGIAKMETISSSLNDLASQMEQPMAAPEAPEEEAPAAEEPGMMDQMVEKVKEYIPEGEPEPALAPAGAGMEDHMKDSWTNGQDMTSTADAKLFPSEHDQAPGAWEVVESEEDDAKRFVIRKDIKSKVDRRLRHDEKGKYKVGEDVAIDTGDMIISAKIVKYKGDNQYVVSHSNGTAEVPERVIFRPAEKIFRS